MRRSRHQKTSRTEVEGRTFDPMLAEEAFEGTFDWKMATKEKEHILRNFLAI
jgi:hypothetical protein